MPAARTGRPRTQCGQCSRCPRFGGPMSALRGVAAGCLLPAVSSEPADQPEGYSVLPLRVVVRFCQQIPLDGTYGNSRRDTNIGASAKSIRGVPERRCDSGTPGMLPPYQGTGKGVYPAGAGGELRTEEHEKNVPCADVDSQETMGFVRPPGTQVRHQAEPAVQIPGYRAIPPHTVWTGFRPAVRYTAEDLGSRSRLLLKLRIGNAGRRRWRGGPRPPGGIGWY